LSTAHPSLFNFVLFQRIISVILIGEFAKVKGFPAWPAGIPFTDVSREEYLTVQQGF
jgi:hypothetical protein